MHIRTVRTATEVVHISRRIVTETVTVPVQLRHEELVVTRRRIDAADDNGHQQAGTSVRADPANTADATGTAPDAEAGWEHVFVLRREVPEVATHLQDAERVTVRVVTIDSERVVSAELSSEQVDIDTAAAPGR